MVIVKAVMNLYKRPTTKVIVGSVASIFCEGGSASRLYVITAIACNSDGCDDGECKEQCDTLNTEADDFVLMSLQYYESSGHFSISLPVKASQFSGDLILI